MHKSDMTALYDEFTIVDEQKLSLDNAFVVDEQELSLNNDFAVDDRYQLHAVTALSTHTFVTVLLDYYDEPGSMKNYARTAVI